MVVSHAPRSIHYAAATAAMNAMWSADRGATDSMTEAKIVFGNLPNGILIVGLHVMCIFQTFFSHQAEKPSNLI